MLTDVLHLEKLSTMKPSLKANRNQRVLIVGAEIGVFEILQVNLQLSGIHAHHAYDGHQAIMRFLELKPDVVLLDIYIQSPDSFEILKNIQNRSKTPIILFTTLPDDENKRLSSSLIGDYISKPFNPSMVVTRIKSALQGGAIDGK